jgi:hypothetical protein
MNSHNRERIQRAIDLLQLVSDDYQHETNYYGTVGAVACQIGYVLGLGRTVDTLESASADLQCLLDQPPRLGGAAPGRTVPGSERPVGAAPGMGVVAA